MYVLLYYCMYLYMYILFMHYLDINIGLYKFIITQLSNFYFIPISFVLFKLLSCLDPISILCVDYYKPHGEKAHRTLITTNAKLFIRKIARVKWVLAHSARESIWNGNGGSN